MQKEELEKRIKNSSSDINKDRMNRLLDNSIELGADYKFEKGSINMVIVMEELAELTQQLSKWVRGKKDILGITEEMADVTIMLEYIKKVCGISQEDINKIINVKLDRLEERDKELVDKGGNYN